MKSWGFRLLKAIGAGLFSQSVCKRVFLTKFLPLSLIGLIAKMEHSRKH